MSEKVFQFYEDLLPELRTVVINEMESDDRCRFTRCSKMSQEEATSSKNYIHSLTFFAAQNYINVTVSFGKQKMYKLLFKEKERRKYIRCETGNRKKLWTQYFESSTDLLKFGAEYFEQLLEAHQHKIKKLVIQGAEVGNPLENYRMKNLNRLECLQIDGCMNVSQYLSALRKPLKNLTVCGNARHCRLLDREEIYEVTNSVNIFSTKVTFEQMLKLRAPVINIPFGTITEIEIYTFIRSWQNGTFGKKVQCYIWDNSGQNFDIPKLFGLLGLVGDFTPRHRVRAAMFNAPPREIVFEIKHNENPDMKAKLSCDDSFGQLVFQVVDDEN